MIIPFTGMIGTSPTSAFTITAFVLLMLYSQDCSEKQDIPLRCAESLLNLEVTQKKILTAKGGMLSVVLVLSCFSF